MKQKMRFLKVTTTSIYMFEDKSINGWSPEEVAEDWFERFHPDRQHVSREAHQLGGATVVQNVEILDEDQFKEYEKEINTQAENIESKNKPKPFPGGESLEWPTGKVLSLDGQ